MDAAMIERGERILVKGHMMKLTSIAPYAIALIAVTAASSAAQAQLAIGNGTSLTVSESLDYNAGATNIDLGSTLNATTNVGSNMPLSLSYGSVNVGISFVGDASLMTAAPNGVLTRLNASTTLNFSADQNYFAMRWGTLDAGNTVKFYNDNQLVSSITGASVIANVSGVTPVATHYGSHYAEFSFGEIAFDKVVMSTTQGGFDVTQMAFAGDAVAVAPIPLNAASLGGLMSFLMMLGMRGKGGTQVAIRMAFASLTPRRCALAA